MEQLRLFPDRTMCPCCGSMVEHLDPAALLEYLPIAGVKREMLRVLVGRFGQDVPTDVLAGIIWSGVRGGGPLDVRGNLSVRAYELRHILRPYGLTVRGIRAVGGYRLEWL